MSFLSFMEAAKRKSLVGFAVESRVVCASRFFLPDLCCVSPFEPASLCAPQSEAQATAQAKAFALCASSFCLGKRNQNRWRLTRAGTAAPPRFPVLLGRCGTAPKLATLKQGRLYGRTSLRCSARSTAQVSQHPRATATAKATTKAKAFALCASSFCLGKRNQNRWRLTRAGTAAPPRSPALLGRCGTAPKLATLKQGRLYGRTSLRCSARSTAQVSQRLRATATAKATPKATATDGTFIAAAMPRSAFVFAFASASSFALASLSLKASRAPQVDTAVEARLFERSEFARRAVSGEERRAPMLLHRIGECQAQTVLFAASRSPFGPASPFAPQSGAVVPFAKTKGTRATARKLLILPLPLPLPLLLFFYSTLALAPKPAPN